MSSGTDGRTGQLTTAVEPFEMRVLLPNRYVRVAHRVGFHRTEGFSDATALRDSRPLTPDLPYRRPEIDATEVASQRAVAARWMIGILGSLDGILPLAATRSAPASYS